MYSTSSMAGTGKRDWGHRPGFKSIFKLYELLAANLVPQLPYMYVVMWLGYCEDSLKHKDLQHRQPVMSLFLQGCF